MNKEVSGLNVDSCVLPFLPMLYVAWSDEVISPAQIRSIEKVLRTSKCLQPDQRQLIQKWLDPENPPSPSELQSWLSYIRENSSELPIDERRSLAELGASLADGDTLPDSGPTVNALNEIETELGVLGEEATAEMLGKHAAVAGKPTQKNVDAKALNVYLDGKHAALRNSVRAIFSRPKAIVGSHTRK